MDAAVAAEGGGCQQHYLTCGPQHTTQHSIVAAEGRKGHAGREGRHGGRDHGCGGGSSRWMQASAERAQRGSERSGRSGHLVSDGR